MKFVLFADNTNIFTSNKDIDELYSETNRELDKLCTWFCVSKLSINIEKTNYAVFSNKDENSVTSIDINNIVLQRVYSTDVPQVFTGHKHTWKEYNNYIGRKIRRCTTVLNKVKHILNNSSLYMLYNL